METYLKKGYSRDWINQRLKSIEVRKELTDEWEDRGMTKGSDFAILTDEITKAWTDDTPVQRIEIAQERKLTRPYDEYGTCAQHAGRSNDN